MNGSLGLQLCGSAFRGSRPEKACHSESFMTTQTIHPVLALLSKIRRFENEGPISNSRLLSYQFKCHLADEKSLERPK